MMTARRSLLGSASTAQSCRVCTFRPARKHRRITARRRLMMSCRAEAAQKERPSGKEKRSNGLLGLGDLLGPIGLTLGGALRRKEADSRAEENQGNDRASKATAADRPPGDSSAAAGSSSLAPELGPIALAFGRGESPTGNGEDERPAASTASSIHDMSTEEWRARYEGDGCVDLWVQEEFNAGSRLVGGRAVHKGGRAGRGSGEGPTGDAAAPRHRVKIYNHHAAQEVDVEVPEDRYILWEAEDQGLLLPYACRMGCCTACAVRILEGDMHQPQSLGVSAELKAAGYGLMCVGYPRSDLVLETVPEDEVYDLQFGRSFAEQAVDPSNPGYIERDDFALEIANMDE